jgi:hypothetical protein
MKLLYALVLLTVRVERSLLLVEADVIAAIGEQDIDVIGEPSTRIAKEENGDESQESDTVEPDPDFPTEVHLPRPASLVRAARVGAIIGEVPKGRTKKSANVERRKSKTTSPNSNAKEGGPHNPKMLTGCHWGTVGCKKGKVSAGEVNSSSVKNNANAGLAGSASVRIEARVMNGRGPSLMQRRPESAHSMSDDGDADTDRGDAAGHEPLDPKGATNAERRGWTISFLLLGGRACAPSYPPCPPACGTQGAPSSDSYGTSHLWASSGSGLCSGSRRGCNARSAPPPPARGRRPSRTPRGGSGWVSPPRPPPPRGRGRGGPGGRRPSRAAA